MCDHSIKKDIESSCHTRWPLIVKYLDESLKFGNFKMIAIVPYFKVFVIVRLSQVAIFIKEVSFILQLWHS